MALSHRPLTLEERGRQVIETTGNRNNVNPDVRHALTTKPLNKAILSQVNMKVQLKENTDASIASRPPMDVSVVPSGKEKITLDTKAAWLSVSLADQLYGAEYKDLTGEQQYFIAVLDGLLKQQGYNSDNLGSTAPHQYLSFNFEDGSFLFHSDPADALRYSTSDGPLEVTAFSAPKQKSLDERIALREDMKKTGTLYESLRAHGKGMGDVPAMIMEMHGDYPNFVEDFNKRMTDAGLNPGPNDLFDASKPNLGYKGTRSQNIAFRDLYLDTLNGFDE